MTVFEILAAAAAINAVTLAAFGWDKFCATRNMGRIRESTLLTLALAGGSPGAFAGRWLFRHKTRKQPFVSRLKFVAIVQVVTIIAAAALYAYVQLKQQ